MKLNIIKILVIGVMPLIFAVTACSSERQELSEEFSQSEEVEMTVAESTAETPSSSAVTVFEGIDLKSLNTEDWDTEVLAEGLVYPWDIHVLDDLIVLTEVVGNIVTIRDGELTRYKIETSDPILQEGGSGLLGMELSENFEESGRAYLYHSYSRNGSIGNKIIAVHFDGNSWRETAVLVEGIPGHNLYNGGRISIGPDGALYAATGWAHLDDAPRNPDSLAGKILRMNTDGSVPEDNPFPGSYVYSLGHRNPQGLAWNAEGSILYSSEHGNIGEDEINIIEPGGDYGWPDISGAAEAEGTVSPVLQSGRDTWAPSGIAFAGERALCL